MGVLAGGLCSVYSIYAHFFEKFQRRRQKTWWEMVLAICLGCSLSSTERWPWRCLVKVLRLYLRVQVPTDIQQYQILWCLWRFQEVIRFYHISLEMFRLLTWRNKHKKRPRKRFFPVCTIGQDDLLVAGRQWLIGRTDSRTDQDLVYGKTIQRHRHRRSIMVVIVQHHTRAPRCSCEGLWRVGVAVPTPASQHGMPRRLTWEGCKRYG